MKTCAFTLFDTPIGCCGIAWGATAITGVQLPEGSDASTRRRMGHRFPDCRETGELPPHVQHAVGALLALLSGSPAEPVDLSDIELDLEDVPPFNRRVYAITRRIAPGHTCTYGEIAARLGEPGAARAVGQALGHNPFAPIVPCHRVLAAGGRSGGFSASGGVATKLRLLQIERARIDGPGLFDADE